MKQGGQKITTEPYLVDLSYNEAEKNQQQNGHFINGRIENYQYQKVGNYA